MDVSLVWAPGLQGALVAFIPNCNLGSIPLLIFIHGCDLRLGPWPSPGVVVPKCNLISFMDVTLGWALGPYGALGPISTRVQFRIIPFLISFMEVTLGWLGL
eukprot:2337037-Karenia_brevis.AAC.1